MGTKINTGGRVIFVGNIPYGLTEEQVTDIFSSAGQVKSFRLVYNKDNHQPKGYGFLEFVDPDAAASAVRNLDQYETMGRRLRVDFTNESGASEGALNNSIHPGPTGAPIPAPDGAPPPPPGSLPPLPTGQDLPQGVSCSDAISQTLSAVPGPQLLDILSTMRGMATSEPQKATALLSSAPQLSYAMFQALLLLGLVDTAVLQSVIGQAAYQQQQQQQQPPPYPPQPPPSATQYPPPPGAYGAPPMGTPQMSTMTPPVMNQFQKPPLRFNFTPDMNHDTRVLIERVFGMSQADLDALDPPVRNQIEQVKSTYSHLIAR